MEVMKVSTRRRSEFIDITVEVEGALDRSGAEEGVVVVYVPHTTAGVTINENADPDVRADVIGVLERLVPQGAGYRHAEGNADSHVKASLVGSSVAIPFSGSKLALGTWQGVYFAEFDGPRSRRVLVKVLRDAAG
ncbi:MAG TPA: secondary thiamine-phosphate synthase enzyme YjbQ [Polyangia bacterium]|nr:secondary thiamine-phosphate synthase enzyme YjbQ [Polyangia bacterium]